MEMDLPEVLKDIGQTILLILPFQVKSTHKHRSLECVRGFGRFNCWNKKFHSGEGKVDYLLQSSFFVFLGMITM